MATNNTTSQLDIASVVGKYNDEKAKRLRADGNEQYVELSQASSKRLAHLGDDPWVDHAALNALEPNLRDGDDVRFLLLGAGFSALINAVRLIQRGFKAEEMRFVDAAGGFGGSWYWNRYPGLMCDVQSSIYLPFLEEMGYMPKHKYSYGPEIREYVKLLTEKFGLANNGVFRTTAESYVWDDEAKRWVVRLTQGRGPNQEPIDMTVKAQFVILTGGVLHNPKAPKIPGLEDFTGEMMHTGRWNYNVSGGSPTDWTLSGLKGKKVGIIGTGATAVQLVPHLAKFAEHVYVFQRTPSAVDVRGQQETDPEEWKALTSKPGWERARSHNFCAMMSGAEVEDQIKDGWTEITQYRHLVGGPHGAPKSMEDVPGMIQQALAVDAPRGERIRKRVDDIVKDKETAEKLKAWYPSWCKRPCFHDDYLDTFNRSNVTLVDTNAKGVERATANGIVAGGKEYEIDILFLGTGYRAPSKDLSDPSTRFNITIKGRNGRLFAEKWSSLGASTLHSILSNAYPNMLLATAAQGAACANWLQIQDTAARHGAYVLSEAVKRAENPLTATVEPSSEAEEEWAMHIMMRGAWLAPAGICGPSYFNNEGQQGSQEEQMKGLRGAPYILGLVAFEEFLDEWRAEGSMTGFTVMS